jgi:GT2 family glycosyltransferase/glycosyltransferase involved in cell wall biosynthesis
MRILQVVHGLPPAASGGTEVYVHGLAGALAAGGDHVAVLTRHSDPNSRELALRRWMDSAVEVFSVNNTFRSCESFESSYSNPEIAKIAGAVLDQWHPDVVHVQHLTCLSTGIPRQASMRRIPVVMTLNDYWLICHRGQLMDLDGGRCEGPWDGGCARCLPVGALATRRAFRSARTLQSMPIPGISSAIGLAARAWEAVTPAEHTRMASLGRLEHMKEAVGDIAVFLAPSATLADAFVRFGVPRERIVRCNQGISTVAFDGVRRTKSEALRIGFAGGLQPTKGADVLLDAVERLPRGSVVVDVIGSAAPYHGDGRFAQALVNRLGTCAVRRFGPVSHDRMPAVLADLDVVVVPSVWIENAPFIIREAFAAGIPVVASNLGGMAEMVRDGTDGLLFAPGDASALAAALRRLLDEPQLLPALRAGIRRPMSIEEDAAALRQIYVRVGATPRKDVGVLPPQREPVSKTARDVTAIVLNYRTPEQTWLAVRSLQSSSMPPTNIVVVDNNSGDGSVGMLQQSLDKVHLIESQENLGFAGGCNIGIRAASENGASFVLLMNSDAIVAPDAIGHLVEAMSRDTSLAIAAPVLLSREEPDQVSSAGISFSERTGRMRHRAAGRRMAALGSARVRTVDAVSGCVMLIRRELFSAVGLLDEAYFFSFEDVDFCLRARDAGFLTACVHDARAYHEGGRSIGRRSPKRIYFGTRNHLRLAARVGNTTTRPGRLALVAGFNAAYVLVSPESPLVGGSAAFVRGVWHHLVGRYGAG